MYIVGSSDKVVPNEQEAFMTLQLGPSPKIK